MGLAKRIIPTLLADGEKLVKGQRFKPWRTVGVVEQAARICGARAVDEIILLDVTATQQGREPNYALVSRITEALHTPLTVGGGVRTIEQVKKLLHAGADKVAICSALYQEGGRELLNRLRDAVGAQAIVAALDTTDPAPFTPAMCYTHSGTRPVTTCWGIATVPPINAAIALAQAGAGEILLTSIEREGTMTGYDLEGIRQIAKAVDIPVIAHGGAGSYQHMLEAIRLGAEAVAAGALFQFTDATPRGAAEYLAAHGIETRIPA